MHDHQLTAFGPNEKWFKFAISFADSGDRLKVTVRYLGGSVPLASGTVVASWAASYEPSSLPHGNDPGHADIGEGRRDVLEEFRGIGIGSYLMHFLIGWVKNRREVPVVPIHLKQADATLDNLDRRNRFWEKLGFTFDYYNEKSWGCSHRMTTEDLVKPPRQLAAGWRLQEG